MRWLHSDIKALDRIELLRDLRLGEFDVLVGVNLLREGLDLPEVSLVVIMEADKEGFLRAERSLVQTIGRAARNSGGRVVMYADRMTDSMSKAIGETQRRRTIQKQFNVDNNIVPTTIMKTVSNPILEALRGRPEGSEDLSIGEMLFLEGGETRRETAGSNQRAIPGLIKKLEKEMKQAAKNLDFERAVELRDQLKVLQERSLKNRKQ